MFCFYFNKEIKPRPFETSFYEKYAPSVGGFLWTTGITCVAMATTTAAVLYRTKILH